MIIRIAIPRGPSEYEQVYDLIAAQYDWSELLPDIQPAKNDFFWWAHKYTWFYAVWAGEDLAGYIMVRGIKDGVGEVHASRMPGFASIVLPVWTAWLKAIANDLHTLEAYIPLSHPRLARLAEIYGFEIEKEDQYYHGTLAQSQNPGPTSPRCPSGDG